MTEQRLSRADEIYLEHILHGQIETKSFWLEQMVDWNTDELGNTPLEQFALILEEVSVYEYVCQLFNIQEGEISVNCIRWGNGIITDIDEFNNYITIQRLDSHIFKLSHQQFNAEHWSFANT